jgi:hypothetical protein
MKKIEAFMAEIESEIQKNGEAEWSRGDHGKRWLTWRLKQNKTWKNKKNDNKK